MIYTTYYVHFLSIVKIIGARLISQNVQILTWNFEAEGEMTFFTLGCLRLLFKAILLYVYRYVTVLQSRWHLTIGFFSDKLRSRWMSHSVVFLQKIDSFPAGSFSIHPMSCQRPTKNFKEIPCRFRNHILVLLYGAFYQQNQQFPGSYRENPFLKIYLMYYYIK